MSTPTRLELDTVIFGGGAAGLWLLDALVRSGHRAVLLEAEALGSGQTIASQGIIHGGMKYSLSGWLTPSAQIISDMPDRWRQSLAGECPPDLTHTTLRGEHCYLWHTQSMRSRFAMTGARLGLAVEPVAIERDDRPNVLADCPGTVARLDEPVIDPKTFLFDLTEQHRSRLLRVDVSGGLEIHRAGRDTIDSITLSATDHDLTLTLHPSNVVFTAGAGNAMLLRAAGRERPAMQRRPLHMVVARGNLPILNGHCVDGRTTRVTITSAQDAHDRTIWQIGGQVAEVGVDLSSRDVIRRAIHELRAVVPGIDLSNIEWMAYRVDRAEARRAGKRPDDITIDQHANITTAWPTKLALVPKLATRILERIECSDVHATTDRELLEATSDWPRPIVAEPPWETSESWITDP